MRDLFFGTGIAHSILLFAVVIASGLWLGRYKIKGVSIGSTWILFVGILLSHFGFIADPTVLAFMKDFGLILFVFSIGLEVGPGFFQSFRSGGVAMNLMAVALVLLAALVTVAIHLITGESLQTMVGVMSGAVTNTPGLGAAQQTITDVLVSEGQSPARAGAVSSGLASAYAVAYPLGVLGVIAILIALKPVFRVDLSKEVRALEAKDHDAADVARRMHCEVANPAIFGKTIADVCHDQSDKFIVSRVMRDGVSSTVGPETVLEKGDRLLIVTTQANVDAVRIIFGEEVPMHLDDWVKRDGALSIRRLVITKPELTGKKLGSLQIRSSYGVTVTRVIRAGVELVAAPSLRLQMGDAIQVVGHDEDIDRASAIVGNKPSRLDKPNLVPIFLGIAVGVIFGSIPIAFPGIPQPIKLGLAGGPLIVAIILGYFGPKWKITTYTTHSANMMIREIGISFFMAAVGLGAGSNFVSSIVNGGYYWILYGAIITIVPVVIIAVIARYVLHFNFYQICGLITGGTTDPAALAFAQDAYGSEYTSVNYATVYPLTMFMRVLVAQVMVLIAMA